MRRNIFNGILAVLLVYAFVGMIVVAALHPSWGKWLLMGIVGGAVSTAIFIVGYTHPSGYN